MEVSLPQVPRHRLSPTQVVVRVCVYSLFFILVSVLTQSTHYPPHDSVYLVRDVLIATLPHANRDCCRHSQLYFRVAS